jgi:hypothetical protein
MARRVPAQTGDGSSAKSTFQDEMRAVAAEEMAKQQGSKTKTPWSAGSYGAGSKFGVTVPKTFDEIFVETGTLGGVIKASDPTSAFYASRRQPSDVPNFEALPAAERQLFDIAAKSIHPMKTGSNYYTDLIEASWDLSTKGVYKSPQQLAYEAYVGSAGPAAGAGGTGGRGGGRAAAYTGPVESITKLADSDIRATADAVAIEILGRGATDEEIKKITQRMRQAEMQQPQVTTRQGPGRTVTEQGLSAQGRDDILRDVLSKNPDFQQYQLDTTVMDAMVNFVNKKKAVAGD